MELPKKITPCPILEAIVEVRYAPKFPNDVIIGLAFEKISSIFGQPQALPIMQLPETVRAKDPNLAYQPYFVFTRGNIQLKIGPRVIIFSNTNEYLGWEVYFKFICDIMEKIHASNIIDYAERIGLRYVDLFSENIMPKIELELKIKDTSCSAENINIRVENAIPPYIKITQVANAAEINSPRHKGKGSVIDIDCIYNYEKEKRADFWGNYQTVIDKAHSMQKEAFFALLKDDFLSTLNPEY